MYTTLYITDHFHDIPIEVSQNMRGWYRARVLEGPAKNVLAFSKHADKAHEAVEKTLKGLYLLGFKQPPEFCYRPPRKRKQKEQSK